jgi:IS30 family transposase
MLKARSIAVSIILGCLLFVVCQGCTHRYRFYNGKKKPVEEIAIIRGKFDANHGNHITFTAIDSKLLNTDVSENATRYFIVELLPGPHAVLTSVRFASEFKSGPRRLNQEVKINAQAGREYQFHAKLNEDKKVKIWFEEIPKE